MKTNALRLFAFLILCAVFVHFILTGIYCFSKAPRTNVFTHLGEQYSVPMFHQNWSLFAPDVPKYDVQLEYRTAIKGSWKPWQDASQSNGFGSRSRIEYIEQNINTGLAWQVVNNLYQSNNSVQFDRIVASNSYRQALHLVAGLVERTFDSEPDSLQLRMNFRFTPAQDKAYTFQTTKLEFPVYQFEK